MNHSKLTHIDKLKINNMIFNIKSLEDYYNFNLRMFEIGTVDFIGNKIPVFEEIDQLFDYYHINDLSDIFDSNGQSLWEDHKYILPKKWLETILEKFLIKNNLKIPFFIVVNDSNIFEIQSLTQNN